jgi:hypothetical protein
LDVLDALDMIVALSGSVDCWMCSALARASLWLRAGAGARLDTLPGRLFAVAEVALGKICVRFCRAAFALPFAPVDIWDSWGGGGGGGGASCTAHTACLLSVAWYVTAKGG